VENEVPADDRVALGRLVRIRDLFLMVIEAGAYLPNENYLSLFKRDKCHLPRLTNRTSARILGALGSEGRLRSQPARSTT
jgi:hypothetical protein